MREGGTERRSDVGTKRGEEVRREGGREPERSRVTSYLYPPVRPTLDYYMPRQAVISTQHKLPH